MPRRSTAPASPVFESLHNAAGRLGYSIHTMRELVNSGRLRAYRLSDKPGSAIRVKIADVDALMQPVIPDAIAGSR